MSTWANEPSERSALDALHAVIEASGTGEGGSSSLARSAERLQQMIQDGRGRDEILAALSEMHALADTELAEPVSAEPLADIVHVNGVGSQPDGVVEALEELDRRYRGLSPAEAVDLDALLASEFDEAELARPAEVLVTAGAALSPADVDALLAAEFDYLVELYPPAPVEDEAPAELAVAEELVDEPNVEPELANFDDLAPAMDADDDFSAALAAALAEPDAARSDLIELSDASDPDGYEQGLEPVHAGASDAELLAFLKGFEPAVAQPEAEEQPGDAPASFVPDSLEDLDLGEPLPKVDAGELLGADYADLMRVQAAPAVAEPEVAEEVAPDAAVDPLYVPAELREDFFARAPKGKVKKSRFGRK